MKNSIVHFIFVEKAGMIMDAKRMGLFISQLRKDKNMTQLDLARKIHVSDKTVSRWERGIGFPDIQLLEPLSNALGITVAELMDCRQKEQYTNVEVSDLMSDYDSYKKECFKQDLDATKLAFVCMIGVSICVYLSGHASFTGSILVGSVFALGVVASYYLICEKESKKIYAYFDLFGIFLFVQFLIIIGLDYLWICYILEMVITMEIYGMIQS